jgi:hypothetical protein
MSKDFGMPDERLSERSLQRHRALSRWENEGGAVGRERQGAAIRDDGLADAPALTDTELVQLRIRVIAIENLLISLLARAPVEQLELAREMADYISPRPGFTHHPMTIRAAEQMLGLLDRSGHFR